MNNRGFTMSLDHADLHTESFSNSRGWTTVRVTQTPSSICVERSRSGDLQSPVQAQKDCIAEIERLLAQNRPEEPEVEGGADDPHAAVTRAEFEKLVTRVEALERGRRLDQ